ISAVLIIVPIVVLIGWAFDYEFLKRVKPSWISMNPLTACCLILLGVSLMIICHREIFSVRIVRIGQFSALFVSVIGFLRLMAYLFNFDPQIDLWLFPQKIMAERFPVMNRMSPSGALNFFLSGLGL